MNGIKLADRPVSTTRYPTLGYMKVMAGLWRVVDISDLSNPATVGPQYRTKIELLSDLARYAKDSWGIE